MRRMLTPSVVLLAGLILGLTGCSGESPTSPTGPGGGSGNGNCNVTISLNATSVNPLAGSAVIVRATVKKGGVAVPDGSSVVFTTDYGTFQETGLPSVSKVTSSGFADVTLTAGASGTSTVKATSDCGSATIAIQFAAVPADGPYISSMTPLTGSCLGGDTVTINGGRFMTTLNIQPRVTFGGAQATVVSATASQIIVLTPSRTLADPSVPETVDVVVTVNPGTSAIQVAAPKKFTYTCLSKRIAVSAVNPNTGRQEGNEPVVISGANFLPTSSSGPATTRVTFGGVPASIVSQTDTTLNVTTPRHMLANPAVPETVDVVVTVDLGLPTQQSASLLHAYTYYASGAGAPCNSDPRLYITQVTVTTPTASPGSPDGGDVVTISGLGFWFGNTTQPQPMSRLKVEFGGVQAVVSAWTDSSIVVVAPRFTLTNPDAPQSVEVKVTVDVGGFREACATVAKAYTYYPGSFLDLYITSMSPSTGPNDASTRVTIFGKNFRFPSQVFVGVAEATVVSITASQIVFMTPTATGARAFLAGTSAPVTVRDTYSGKTVTSPVNFQYYACPTVGTAAPATAAWNVSTPVTISGQAFEEPVEAVFVTGTSSFRVNVVSVSSSLIVVQMPVLDQLLGTGNIGCADVSGSIQLTFPGLACAGKISVPFTYQINRPTIATVSPQTALPQGGGSSVTVTGSNFVDPMEVEIVGVGGVTVRVHASVGSSQTLTFVTPNLPDSMFISQDCTVVVPNDGTQLVPTWMMVRVVSDRTSCTAQLGNSILFNPSLAGATCHLKAPAISGPVSPSVSICAAATVGPYAIVGGTTPYLVSAPGLPPGLSAVLAGSGTAMNITGTPVMPASGVGNASTPYPVTITVTDANGKTGTLAISITVADPGAPFAITPAGSVTLAAGATATFTAGPGIGAITWTPVATILPAPVGGTLTVTTGATTSIINMGNPKPTNGPWVVTLSARDTACGTTYHTVTSVITVN
jgi:IPT/TIG domain